ncbi:AmmeMemoRadiSam system protein B [Halapricum desulfuricans]|uniref:Multifunctional fusion protein n=1 Tax=Halapricum desulfuricans TaxID=2841257 RepID=A0A897NA13_9EURY|nr:AmmeMemoRadiSam system protein B [Halapricum desulfuricans]QSG09251.1 putative class III extradiol dioxygenase, MEMO1family [Halapricum desulfuricans]
MARTNEVPAQLDHDAGRTLVSRARQTVEAAARSDGEPTPSGGEPADRLQIVRGVFVTIKRGEQLRGCIGRPDPDEPLAETVVDAAIDAALHDPRVEPVGPDELDDVTVSVSVLSKPEPLPASDPSNYPQYVDVGRHGLIAERDSARGLLLPQVAVDNDWRAERFLEATCQKARLPGRAWREDGVEIRRFSGRVFTEAQPGGTVIERPLGRPSGAGKESTGDGGGLNSDGPGEPRTDGGGVRTPAVAGGFYAGDADGLEEQLRESFTHEVGPGSLAEHDADPRRPLGLIVPHAGYPYSGPVAAHAYATLARSDTPETVVVFGPNHRRVGESVAVAPHDRWRTPLGDVPVDRELAETVVDRHGAATFDPVAHEGEHSIEVQVPFLQHVLPEVSILPICLGTLDHDRAERLGTAVADAVDRTGRSAVVVGSTDLTHYQPHEAAVEADRPVREAIERLDSDTIASLSAEGHSMCGPWSTVATVSAARELGSESGDILAYATSADTAGSPDRVVGYCAAAIR